MEVSPLEFSCPKVSLSAKFSGSPLGMVMVRVSVWMMLISRTA